MCQRPSILTKVFGFMFQFHSSNITHKVHDFPVVHMFAYQYGIAAPLQMTESSCRLFARVLRHDLPNAAHAAGDADVEGTGEVLGVDLLGGNQWGPTFWADMLGPENLVWNDMKRSKVSNSESEYVYYYMNHSEVQTIVGLAIKWPIWKNKLFSHESLHEGLAIPATSKPTQSVLSSTSTQNGKTQRKHEHKKSTQWCISRLITECHIFHNSSGAGRLVKSFPGGKGGATLKITTWQKTSWGLNILKIDANVGLCIIFLVQYSKMLYNIF